MATRKGSSMRNTSPVSFKEATVNLFRLDLKFEILGNCKVLYNISILFSDPRLFKEGGWGELMFSCFPLDEGHDEL